jgi:hypothetical protein
MVDVQLIREFFHRYGSKITDPNGKNETYGVLSPFKSWDSEREEKNYPRAGYQMKCEYVLLTLNESGVVQKNASLCLNGKTFHVITTDWYYYANKPLYLRAYLCEEGKP